jgi:hypothetical protein
MKMECLANGRSLFTFMALAAALPAQNFGPPVVTNHPFYAARGVTFPDLDRDGNTDLVAVDFSFPQGRMAYALGDGAGGFGSMTIVPTLFAAVTVASGDLDFDGLVDVVVSNPSGQTAVHFGQTSGLLGPPNQITGVYRPLIVDADGNGIPDLVGTAPNNLSMLSIVFGNGHRGFPTSQQFQLTDSAINLAAVDLDGDGRPEFVAFSSNATRSSYQVLRRNGSSFVLDPAVVFYQGSSTFGGVGDFDEDGREDLIMGVGSTVQVFRGNGIGFDPGVIVISGTATMFVQAITDFDGDGHLDIVYSQQNGTPMSALGLGNGTFGPGLNQPDMVGTPAAFVDVTRDGVPDYVLVGSNTIETRSQLGVVRSGVSPYGTGSPSCTGAITIGLDSDPLVGNLAMRVRCANVPRGAVGLVFGGGEQNIPGFLFLGARLHAEQVHSITLGSGPVDASGTFSVPMPIPNEPSVHGVVAFVQGVFLAHPGDGALCGAFPFGIISSLGLRITAQ